MPIEADDSLHDALRRERPDIVFNIAECAGGPFRESYVPTILEMLGIPYTGSDPLALALTLHKALTKKVLLYHGIATPPFVEYDSVPREDPPFGYPAIVKPVHEGSGKGIRNDSVVRDRAALEDRVERVLDLYRQPALVERFLPGREFTVAILGNGAEARALPIVGMRFDTLPAGAEPVYGYEAKWLWDVPERPLDIFECPARVDEQTAAAVARAALDAFRVLGCRDWCRVDIRCDEHGVPNVLELNPLPGIIPAPEANSCFPKAARAAGLAYDALVREVLAIACRRTGLVCTEVAAAAV